MFQCNRKAGMREGSWGWFDAWRLHLNGTCRAAKSRVGRVFPLREHALDRRAIARVEELPFRQARAPRHDDAEARVVEAACRVRVGIDREARANACGAAH